MPYASEKRRALTAIFIVFLFIFSEVLVAENDYHTELEDLSYSHSIYSYSANHEVHISSQDPNNNFIGSSESSIGLDSSTNEYRSLYRFSNNLSKSTDLILSAQLKLTCNVIYQDSSSQIPILYPSTVIANFAPSEVTWNNIADSIPWQTSGVDGEFDRKEWDVPSDFTTISANVIQYNLNVTKLAQNSLDLGRNNFDMIVSSLGGYVNCAKSNNATTTYHPELIISHSQGTHGDGGSVEQDFARNEAPLMKDDFIMSADTNPTISFDNLVGSGVEFQFSLSEDFRNTSDLSWQYSTITSQFSRIGQAGSYDIPSSEAFPLGSKVNYRFRSIDNTSFISDWVESFILLPDYTTINNNDGTATVTLSNNDFNAAGIDLIDDTYIDSSVIQNYGDEPYLYVSNDVNKNKISLVKINFDALGIHTNSTILSASIELDRETVTATGPELSLHPIDYSSWEENEATWNYGKVGQIWTSGGLDSLGTSEASGINSNSISNSFSLDIQNSVQQHLDDASTEAISFALTGFMPGDSNPSQTEEIKFYSSEQQGISGFGPKINITYAWTNNQSTPSAELNYPIDESPAWEIIENNISGDTTPTLEWQSSDSNFRNYLLQVSTDDLFRNLIINYDSRIQGTQSLNVTQNYTFSSVNQLTKGELYHWRIKQIDGDNRVGAWNHTSFFISLLESEWLGGDMFRFVINNSLDTGINAIPGFKFSSISSNTPSTNSYGYPHLFVADSMSLGKYNALLGLQLNSYSLPSGYAIISSNLSMKTQSSSGGSIDVGVWELSSNDWNEQEVTWLESSSGNPWNSPGASGALDRFNLLSTSSVAANCCTTWNVTSSIQNSMRDGYNPSFMFEMMPNSYGSNALFYSPQTSNPSFQPQLEIIFTLGSSQKPTPPNADSPTSGEWLFKNNTTLESETNLELVWSHNNPMPIIGWALEIDSTDTFDSIDKRSVSSWNDPGFDIVGGSYTLQSPLDIGKKWHWKVRGLSNTYQLGDWSQEFTFYLPDLNYNQVQPGLFTTEYFQGSAFTNAESLDFTELFVTDSILPQLDNGVSNTILTTGKLANGDNSSILISVPMPLDIHPENASLISATFSLEATSLSSQNVRLAIREILQPWDINANNSMYDSTNNWSQFGGRGIGTDISEPIDIVNSQIGKNQWNITEYVQKALSQGKTSLSLMIYTDADQIGQLVYFHSSESQSSKPSLNMTWAEGQRSIPTDLPNTITPMNGQIYYNQSSHAVIPELRPTYSWSIPQLSTSNPDAWRIYFQIDPNNDMDGELMFDSRTNPELFDLNTLEFIPNQDINFGSDINWFVQPIELGMFGYRSNMSTYYIPNSVGQELNQTDATIIIQDGNIFQSTNFPLATSDTYLDEGNPSQSNNLNGLLIGNSTLANSNMSSTTSLINFNWSMIDLPSVFEVISAELELTAISGSGEVDVSASRLLTDWDENSTWNNSSLSSQWLENGALRGGDSDLPDSIVFVDSVGTHTWNITRILQVAIDLNHDSASVLLQPEIINSLDGSVNGNYLFADSEYQDISLRPKLSIQYRTSQQWLPSAVTLLSPSNGSTLWNETTPALLGADNISFEITQPASNYTTINLCHGKELRWLDCVELGDNIENYSWDSISKMINYTDYESIQQEQGDEWQFWRVRIDQEHRIGYYSDINAFRVPEEQTTYDGIENYQVEFYRGSVFQTTSDVPEVIDASTDSINPQNLGQSSVLSIGTNVNSGGVFESYFEYDFSELFFVPTATPISMILELEVSSNQITQSPMSVALYACDSFDELAITSLSTPTCSSTEITRTSLTSNSGNIISWDLTSLGQTNFFTSNDSLAFRLAAISGQNNFIEFHSSETNSGMKPKINLTYIENPDQYMPPEQPVPVAPQDGQILYDTNSLPVGITQSVQLDWSHVSSATTYKLFIKSNGFVSVYDSASDLRFSGNTFTGTFFNPGQSYEWWVQGYNQSIPGPPSQKWIFGVGEPDHIYNKDGTFVYTLSDSSEIPDFNHINVQDNWITSADVDMNYGISDTLVIGGGCNGVVNSVCDAVISIDTSQIPVDSNSQSLHSITLDLFVESWDLTGGAYEVDFSVHEFLYANWDEMTLTWNNTGIAPGPQPGVDFAAMPIDVKTYTSSDLVLSFDVAQEGQVLGDVLTFLIRGTPISGGGNFDGFVSVFSSDSQNVNVKPKWRVFHTNVSSLNITSPNSYYNADDSYTFDVQSFDFNGLPISGGVPFRAIIEWTTTSGSVTYTSPTTTSLSPTTSGLQVISACYGIICTDYTINIDSGEPVQLFASLSSTSDVNFATITADETITVSAFAVDQHGNLVTNEVISFTSTNGTVSTNGLFSPYSTGIQTITAEWIGTSNSLQEDLQVEVTPGAPVQVDISGCNEVIHADTTCDIFGTAFDQFDNLVWFDDVGDYTLNPINGEILQVNTPTPHTSPPSSQILIGEYTGDLVGEWEVGFSSLVGITNSLTVTVTHGVIQSFELGSSSETISADEVLYLNTTRIDVRGNRLPVTLPIDNWTFVADGQLVPGLTASWYPLSQGTKSISATYQGYTETIQVFVTRGLISDLNVIIDGEVSNGQVFSITADDEITSSIIALDANGNQWLVDGNWSYFHPDFADESILSSNYSQEVTFSPIMSSSTPYLINVEHTELGVVMQESFVVYVSVGDVENFDVESTDSNGINYNNVELFEITSDEFIQFSFTMTDFDLNPTAISPLWVLENVDTGEIADITQDMEQNALIWHATEVGIWEITTYIVNNRGFNLTSQFDIIVSHGAPVSLTLQQSVTTQDAGNFVDLQVTGTDSDGNQFPQAVVWLENNGPSYNINSTDEEGIYQFNGRSAGNYSLTAEYLTLSNSVYVEVFPLGIVKNIKSNISTVELEQLEVITVQIDAYDLYWNKIPVPNSARIDTTDRGDVKYLGGGVWELSTLDEGDHSATIVIGSITETFTYNVEGNLAGFFAAGGPLYYVGAGLIGLIVIALLVFVIRFVRGDEDYYDDDEDEDGYYQESSETPVTKDFSQPRISQAPTVPTPPAQPPSTEPEPEPAVEESPETEEEDTSWMADYRVDDDGTEWGQTEDGVWYYRDSGSNDWVEWTE